MPTYEIRFEGEPEFVECESMEDALHEAGQMVNSQGMDWCQREGDEIAYYDYFVDVIIERYFDDEDDEEDDDDEEEEEGEQESSFSTRPKPPMIVRIVGLTTGNSRRRRTCTAIRTGVQKRAANVARKRLQPHTVNIQKRSTESGLQGRSDSNGDRRRPRHPSA